MKINHINDMKNGWMVGNFNPSVLKTKDLELGHHKYSKGHISEKHYHAMTNEINYILQGKIKVNNHLFLETGHVFVVSPYEIITVEFLEDTDLIIARDGSYPKDKIIEKVIEKPIEKVVEECL